MYFFFFNQPNNQVVSSKKELNSHEPQICFSTGTLIRLLSVDSNQPNDPNPSKGIVLVSNSFCEGCNNQFKTITKAERWLEIPKVADVICRQLGFDYGADIATEIDHIAVPERFVWTTGKTL